MKLHLAELEQQKLESEGKLVAINEKIKKVEAELAEDANREEKTAELEQIKKNVLRDEELLADLSGAIEHI